jgi:nitrogenase molybdenum-cofactor synthesis protein NifE
MAIPRVLLELARAHHADLLVAGGRNLYTALKARLPFVDVNQEREHGYAGYRGMITLAQELTRTLESPILGGGAATCAVVAASCGDGS